ncbi:MAG: N-acetyltransferase family protein [Thermoplasmatota archaeon]
MEIRTIVEKDLYELVEMVFRNRRERVPEFHREMRMEITDIFKRAMADPSSEVLVCIEDGKVLGYINVHYVDFPMVVGRECYVTDLLVGETERGKGAGRALLEGAEAGARKRGCTRMMLNSGKFAKAYQKDFYGKTGYSERKNFANFVKNL